MRRMLGALAITFLATAVVQAHAIYIVANVGDATTQITVVFSDDLKPDPRVKEATWKKLEGVTLTVQTRSGKTVSVKTEKAEACLKSTYMLTGNMPDDPSLIFTKVDYGVSTKGEKSSRLFFYPKAILGDIPEKSTVGGPLQLELVPKVEGGKVRFQVLAEGKPVKDATVNVMLPKDDQKEKATTDEKGWTQAFEGTGRYGVTVRHVEAKGGVWNGTKYEQTTHVATLVVDVK